MITCVLYFVGGVDVFGLRRPGVLLVLLQLPKKEAGAGMAFGGAATDALFGAGSGNVLTKITKYAAGIFFALALLMAVMTASGPKSGGALLLEEVTKSGSIPLAPSAPATTPVGSGGLLQLSNVAPAAPAPSRPRPIPRTRSNRA